MILDPSKTKNIVGINQFIEKITTTNAALSSMCSTINELQSVQKKTAEINNKINIGSQSLNEKKKTSSLSGCDCSQQLITILQQMTGELKNEKTSQKNSTPTSAEIVKGIFEKNIEDGVKKDIKKVLSGNMRFDDMSKAIYENIIVQLKAQISTTVGNILTKMSMNLYDIITNSLGNLGDIIKETLAPVFNSLQETLAPVFNSIKETLSPVISSIGSAFGGFFNNLFKGTGESFSQLSSLVPIFASLLGFASGGVVRGPGSETSDSIPARLSNGEFVTRAAVVKQPGMLPFLHDVNSRGMSALAEYGIRIKHATGGLAGIPAPNMPMLGLGSIKPSTTSNATTVENAVNLHVYDDPKRIIGTAFGEGGMKNFYLEIARDPQKLKAILQL